MKKKLQVFISSTYTDLIEERQSAVQAVLDAGHIPAGMELFKAGNKSQLETIKKWIDNCDVFMLILGGRYGSIEDDSGKSYTQLEYEYATDKNIPVFAVVLSDSFLFTKASEQGKDKIFEAENKTKYDNFKSLVMSKIIRSVEDSKDIKLAVHSTLSEFIDDYDLIGWVRGNCITNELSLLKENKDISKENLGLIKENQKLQNKLKENSNNIIGEFTFEKIKTVLENYIFNIPENKIGKNKAKDINALEFYKICYNDFCTGISNQTTTSEGWIYIFYNIAPYYIAFGLLERVKLPGTTAQRIQTSKLGSKFYGMLNISKQQSTIIKEDTK